MAEYTDDQISKSKSGKMLRNIFLGLIMAFVVWSIASQIIGVILNLYEFGELFVRPFYFAIIGGTILATITLFRIDFMGRRSLFWWSLHLFAKMLRSRGGIEAMPPEPFDFSGFRLSPLKFFLWQITKVLIGISLFANAMFGMAVTATIEGWDSGIGGLTRLVYLPFSTPQPDMAYAQTNVIPLVPSLTLLIPAILSAIGVRLILLVGVTNLVRIIAPYMVSYAWGSEKPRFSIATIEALISLGLFWTMVNFFFPSYIDFNTRYIIIGLGVAGSFFAVFAVFDRFRKGLLIMPSKRSLYLRGGAIVIVTLLIGSSVAVNSSIADARKLEWLGPYTVQEIAVNRYFADLNDIEEIAYNFSALSIPPTQIDGYVSRERELLSKVRLWDWEAAFAKLKPEIGLIPYIDFQDSDIIRFNGSLYWSASMKPILPTTVRAEDAWYATHLVYTHVPNGFLILDGHEGRIIDTGNFYQQRKIYYGESGLLQETWAAYPVGRERSDELGGYFYGGNGGFSIAPPLSWIFEPNFLLSYPDRTIHVIRYRDAFERMQLLFPYFEYSLFGESVDMYPVTDGETTYWAMPLIVALNTRNVPWSTGNPILKFVGYALIDTYNGHIQIIVMGKDYFSELFKTVYQDYVTTDVPEWLKSQARYPEEYFEWRGAMYNFYHVTDVATFIAAKEFFVVPQGLDTYYIMAKPPGFDKPEFIGLLSLELRGAAGRNLAGYMVVRNDYPNFGEMVFYKVPLESVTKLLGPTGVREALERDPDFATLRTLLRTPRVGDNILYRIGEHDVYFIPVYTAPGGGVVTQIGTIAAVGATFTGEYYVGLGNTAEQAFRAYLAKLGGVEPARPQPELGVEERQRKLFGLFQERGLSLATPVATFPDVSFFEGDVGYVSEADWDDAKTMVESFISRWVEPNRVSRVLTWSEDSKINFGVLVRVEGLLELHYITIVLS